MARLPAVRRLHTHRFLPAVLLLGCLSPWIAGAQGLDRLVANSPFAPTATDSGGAANDGQPLEFRGFFMDQGEIFFSIFNPAAKSSTWISLNEAGYDFTVRSFDSASQTITVEFKGRTLTLSLRKAPVVATVPDPTLPTVIGTPPPTPAVAATPSSEEAKRLADLAAEIRRRRAMRQQVAPPPNTAAPAPPSR